MKTRLLKKGDTILCSDKDDAVSVGTELSKHDIEWDFDYSMKPKILIVILKDEKEK